ncbi:unnamed protein product, partial [marine sediment metagenome]
WQECVAYAKALRGRRDKMFLGFSWYQEEMRKANFRTCKALMGTLDKGMRESKLEYVDVWRITMLSQSGRHTEDEVASATSSSPQPVLPQSAEPLRRPEKQRQDLLSLENRDDLENRRSARLLWTNHLDSNHYFLPSFFPYIQSYAQQHIFFNCDRITHPARLVKFYFTPITFSKALRKNPFFCLTMGPKNLK